MTVADTIANTQLAIQSNNSKFWQTEYTFGLVQLFGCQTTEGGKVIWNGWKIKLPSTFCVLQNVVWVCVQPKWSVFYEKWTLTDEEFINDIIKKLSEERARPSKRQRIECKRINVLKKNYLERKKRKKKEIFVVVLHNLKNYTIYIYTYMYK